MTGFEPGWYPDPDDPDARRYWDGQSWSAPLPKAPPKTDPEDLASWQVRAQERQTDIRPGTDWAAPPPRPVQPFAGVTPPSGSRAIVCPHCGTQGKVTAKQVKQKKGVSGAKLTGAVFTGGLSMIGTGLSRKEKVTEMRCGRCATVWHV